MRGNLLKFFVHRAIIILLILSTQISDYENFTQNATQNILILILFEIKYLMQQFK